MKFIIFSLSVMLLAAAAVFPQKSADAEVIAVVKRAAAAQENYEPAILEQVYASDYVEISPKGEIDRRAAAIGFYKPADVEKARAQTPKYILDNFDVRRHGKFALIIAKFSFGMKGAAEKPPTPVALVAYALRKKRGVWKIYSTQFTPFPRS